MPNYGDSNYWEERYLQHKETSFDWLEDYDSLKGIFEDLLKSINTENLIRTNLLSNIHSSPNILMLGCGNSELSEKLYRGLNLKNVFSIDTSPHVIQTMRERVGELQWEVMDAKDLKFTNSFFDIVVDKATMDSVLCGDSPFLNVAIMMREVQRVLKTGGVYLLVSYGEPDFRTPHLLREHLSLDINVQCLKKSFILNSDSQGGQIQEKTHYVYICKKRNGADFVCQEKFSSVYLELEGEDIFGEEDEFTQNEQN